MFKKVFVILFVLGIVQSIFSQKTETILSNFRIENSDLNKVYFDAVGDISSLTTAGFIISGKKITGIDTNRNFLIVSEAFTFWENSTIRLKNGDGAISDFSMQYISNKIKEPKSDNEEWFVDASVRLSGDGKSQNSAFKTIMEGVAAVTKGGATIHIKAGNYGSENVTLYNEFPSNSFNAPFVLQGYQTVPGDLNGVKYFDFNKGKNLDASQAPLLDGGSRSNGIGILLAASGVKNSDYMIIRNLQVQNFKKGILSNGGNNLVLENCIVRNMGTGTSDNGVHFYSGRNNRIINCISINASVAAFNISGDFNHVERCEAYGEDSGNLKMDYYFTVKGRNSIYRNNYSKKILVDGKDWEHGFSVSGDKVGDTEYNLIENQETTSGVRGIELRRAGCSNNVVRGAYSHDTELGIQIRDGANNNIVENSYFLNVSKAIDFSATSEIGLGSAYNNTLKNIVISNAKNVVFHRGNTTSDKPEVAGNKFYNLTIYNSPLFWKNYLIEPKISSNEWINCNIVGVKSQGYSKGQTFSNCNFFGSWQTLVGGSNISEDPQFVNPGNNDFRIKINSKLINAGKKLESVKKDFDGNGRPQGSSHDIGAFEFQEENISSIDADAGADKIICLGEEIILTAKGGSNFKWSTGETSASIKVRPLETTIYSVIVSQDGESDTDSVEVKVNNVNADAGQDISIEAGSSVTLTASGGGSYLWSNGAKTKSITVSPTISTTFSVIVTNGNCQEIDEIKVTINKSETNVIAVVSQDQEICKGDVITLEASGGPSFLWSTGEITQSITVSPNLTTIYSVKVSDGAVSDTKDIEIKVNEVFANAGVDKTIEFGSSVTLTASGGNSYLWNTGATSKSIVVSPSNDTVYKVVTSNGDCTATDEVIIKVNSQNSFTPFIEGPNQTICNGESVTLTAKGGSSFLWNNGETSESIIVNPTENTKYTVSVFDGISSGNADFIVQVENCSVRNPQDNVSIKLNVYPNPVEDIMNVNIEDGEEVLDLNLLSLEGKIVYYDKMISTQNGMTKQIDVSQLSKGIYFLRLFNSNNSFVKKVMIL